MERDAGRQVMLQEVVMSFGFKEYGWVVLWLQLYVCALDNSVSGELELYQGLKHWK